MEDSGQKAVIYSERATGKSDKKDQIKVATLDSRGPKLMIHQTRGFCIDPKALEEAVAPYKL